MDLNRVKFTAFKTHPIGQDFILGRHLGNGAYGSVRVAVDRATSIPYAVKILNKALAVRNQRELNGVLHEIGVMQKISREVESRHLVKFIAAYENDQEIFIVQELCPDGDLFEHIEKVERFSENCAAYLMRQVIQGLLDLHSAGIVHRDIKPENLLLIRYPETGEKLVKIADFGLAALVSDVERLHNFTGTEAYLAPEQIQAPHKSSFASDVWAAGVVLYIALSGKPPFFGDTRKALFERICEAKPLYPDKAWSNISESCRDFLGHMLEPDPAQRWTVHQLQAHPWLEERTDCSVQLKSTKVIHTFNAKRKFRSAFRACVLGAAFKRRQRRSLGKSNLFTPEEVQELNRRFHAVSSSSPGGTETIDKKQFEQIMGSMKFSRMPLEKLFDAFTQPGSTTLAYKEFLCGLYSFHGINEQSLRFCFELYDRSGDGRIRLADFEAVLRATCTDDVALERVVAARLSALSQRHDLAVDGTINFEEFKNLIKREPLLVKVFLLPGVPVLKSAREAPVPSPTCLPTPMAMEPGDDVGLETEPHPHFPSYSSLGIPTSPSERFETMSVASGRSGDRRSGPLLDTPMSGTDGGAPFMRPQLSGAWSDPSDAGSASDAATAPGTVGEIPPLAGGGRDDKQLQPSRVPVGSLNLLGVNTHVDIAGVGGVTADVRMDEDPYTAPPRSVPRTPRMILPPHLR